MQAAHSKSAWLKSDGCILQSWVIFGHVHVLQQFSTDVLHYMSINEIMLFFLPFFCTWIKDKAYANEHSTWTGLLDEKVSFQCVFFFFCIAATWWPFSKWKTNIFFLFLNIADQQGLSKIYSNLEKYTSCPCEDQSVFGASPPWLHSRLIAVEVHVFALAGSTNFYACKCRLQNCAEMTVSAEQMVVSRFLQKLSAFCSNSIIEIENKQYSQNSTVHFTHAYPSRNIA